jgi:predicted dehydrogenase
VAVIFIPCVAIFAFDLYIAACIFAVQWAKIKPRQGGAMNIALIGLGMVAATHVHAVKNAPKLHLSGVLGRDSAKTADFAARHATRAFGSVHEIAQDPTIDFVILATPPNARRDIVQVLAAAGKPILMEKPIEREFQAASDLVRICAQAGVPLAIMLQHRAREASQALNTALKAGDLGEICTVDLRVPWWRAQSYYDAPGRGTYGRDGGGVMISQAIHTLDLAIWLLGPICSVQAMMRQTALHQLEAEDWAGALFEMQCGAFGTLLATTAAYPGGAETIALQGTKAAAHLGSGVLEISYLDGHITRVGAEADTGGGADPMAFTHEWHQTLIEDFAKSLSTGDQPLATGETALEAQAVIDAMQRSSESGQKQQVQRWC